MNVSVHARTTTVLAMIVLCASVARGQTSTVYNFLRNDVGARAAAMGGNLLTAPNDPDALFYNPATLATLEGPRGSLGYFKHILDINAGHIVYGQPVENVGFLGAGVLYTNYGSFTQTDESGVSLGTFSAGDVALTLSYANFLDTNLSYGANLKFIYSSIAGYTSTGLAGDVGILYRIPDSRLALGASIRNVGTQFSTYLGAKEKIPLDVAVGLSVIPKGLPLLFAIGFHRLNDEVDSFGDRFRAFTVGGEFTLSKVLQLRFGYDNARRKDLQVGSTSGLAGFSTGLGIHIQEWNVDFALSSLGKVATLYRISLGRSF
jgi:hypothetical protein